MRGVQELAQLLAIVLLGDQVAQLAEALGALAVHERPRELEPVDGGRGERGHERLERVHVAQLVQLPRDFDEMHEHVGAPLALRLVHHLLLHPEVDLRAAQPTRHLRLECSDGGSIASRIHFAQDKWTRKQVSTVL